MLENHQNEMIHLFNQGELTFFYRYFNCNFINYNVYLRSKKRILQKMGRKHYSG